MKIEPKCLNFNSRDNKGAAYTSDGFMLPCCWMDDPPLYEYIKEIGLKDPDLALDENESLEQIFTSDQWEHFFQTLICEPEKACYMCKKKCGVDFTPEEVELRKAEENLAIVRQSFDKNY